MEEHDSTLIDCLGGTVKVAALCEVSPQAVSHWRREGIPRARLMYLRVLRRDLVGGGGAAPVAPEAPRAAAAQEAA